MAGEGSVGKRLQSELMGLMAEPVPGVSAFPDGADLRSWKATISGASGGYYAGMEFSLALAFPPDYPLSPPAVTFVTPIFHPNVDMSGNICLDILKEKWSAAFSVATLLLAIQTLLDNPNNESPLNAQAAQLWASKPAFAALAKNRYATRNA